MLEILKRENVEEFIRVAFLMFPENARSEDEKSLMIAVYWKAFSDARMTAQELSEGGMNALSGSRFFPKPVEVIDQVKLIRADKIRFNALEDTKLLLADCTNVDPKNVERCKEMGAVIARRLIGEDEEGYITEAEAGIMLDNIKDRYSRG
jgi:hypothetical protein